MAKKPKYFLSMEKEKRLNVSNIGEKCDLVYK